jgi:hypothetical protein
MRSNLLAFGAGLAAGAVACATYPRWKARVAPLATAVVAGASAAFRDAQAAAREGQSCEPHAAGGPTDAAGRNGFVAATPTYL